MSKLTHTDRPQEVQDAWEFLRTLPHDPPDETVGDHNAWKAWFARENEQEKNAHKTIREHLNTRFPVGSRWHWGDDTLFVVMSAWSDTSAMTMLCPSQGRIVGPSVDEMMQVEDVLQPWTAKS